MDALALGECRVGGLHVEVIVQVKIMVERRATTSVDTCNDGQEHYLGRLIIQLKTNVDSRKTRSASCLLALAGESGYVIWGRPHSLVHDVVLSFTAISFDLDIE